MDIVVPTSFNICFGCTREPSHLDGSYEAVLLRLTTHVLVEK